MPVNATFGSIVHAGIYRWQMPPANPALLQYYNNAREISSSPPTPQPHNEIVMF